MASHRHLLWALVTLPLLAMKIYPGAKHVFNFPGSKHDPAAAEDAEARALACLRRWLGKRP